jgi:hypothetical protein
MGLDTRFGLPHTHGRDFQTVREAVDYVLSARPLEDLDGDHFLIDDTSQIPTSYSFRLLLRLMQSLWGGQAFSFARKNIMSYWDHEEQDSSHTVKWVECGSWWCSSDAAVI